MKTKLAIISLALTLAACQTSKPSPTALPPGTYNSTEKSVNPNGTEVQKDTTTTVSRNPDGTKSATVHKKTTKDPKGLMNKSTTTESVKTY